MRVPGPPIAHSRRVAAAARPARRVRCAVADSGGRVVPGISLGSVGAPVALPYPEEQPMLLAALFLQDRVWPLVACEPNRDRGAAAVILSDRGARGGRAVS